MNLDNYTEVQLYKKLKIQEVAKFLEGINFKKIGMKEKQKDSQLVEPMLIEGKPVSFDFINNNHVCRAMTEEALLDISAYYTEMVTTYLEDVNSKEEVEKAVLDFFDKTMLRLNILKDVILNKFYREGVEKKEQASLLDTSLDIFKIKLGEQLLSWKSRTDEKSETTIKENDNYVNVNNLRMILLYIYALPNMVKDKRDKLKKMHDDILTLDVGTKEYNEMNNAYWQLFKNRNYDEFNSKYEEINKPKSRG